MERFLNVSRGQNTYLMDDAICPYCGYVDRDSWEFEGSEEDSFCGNCDRKFALEIEVSRTYSTYPLDDEENEEE